MGKIISSRNAIIFTAFISIVLLVGGTIWKVQNESLQRSMTVVSKRITEGFQKCHFDDVCQKSQITLGELIHLGYAKEEVNPETKLYYSHDSIVRKDENNNYFFEEEAL